MKSCGLCVHNRVCGLKDKYEQYVKEFNELNKKWDAFQTNPICPEYMNKNSTVVERNTYDNENINTLLNEHIDRPMTVCLNNSKIEKDFSLEDVIKELKKMKYVSLNNARC